MSIEHRREGEPQLHHRQQRVPAGDQLGVLAVLGEQRDGLVDRAGPDVVEGGRDHCDSAIVSAADSTARTML